MLHRINFFAGKGVLTPKEKIITLMRQNKEWACEQKDELFGKNDGYSPPAKKPCIRKRIRL